MTIRISGSVKPRGAPRHHPGLPARVFAPVCVSVSSPSWTCWAADWRRPDRVARRRAWRIGAVGGLHRDRVFHRHIGGHGDVERRERARTDSKVPRIEQVLGLAVCDLQHRCLRAGARALADMVLIRRVRNRGQDSDDGDRDHQLDEREAPCHPHASSLCRCDPKDTARGTSNVRRPAAAIARRTALRGVVRVKSVTTRAVTDAAAL